MFSAAACANGVLRIRSCGSDRIRLPESMIGTELSCPDQTDFEGLIPSMLQGQSLFLSRDNCILAGFGHSELHNRFCRYLDSGARLRIAAHSGLAL